MKKWLILISLISFVSCKLLYAQYPNNNFWVFGDSAGIDWTNPQSPQFFKSNVKSRCGTSVIGDSINGLNFYCHYNYLLNFASTRVNVTNKFGSLMTNGDTIFSEDGYHPMICLPSPNNDSIYYLFTIGIVGIVQYGLFYSIINYKANNDSGIVVQKNIQLNNLPAFDGLTAVRHGNGRDWWLFFKRNNPNPPFTVGNNFYIYSLDSTGVGGPTIQSIGNLYNDNGGQLIFNKKRD
jgi:hypothetical protein